MICGWQAYQGDDGIPDSRRVACDPASPDCTNWEVVGPGSPSWMGIECNSLFNAERLERAFAAAFLAGRRARSKELKDILDGKDIV